MHVSSDSPADDESFGEVDTMRSPLASTTPPPLSLEAFRVIAARPGAVLPPGMLTAMRAILSTEADGEWARELETLFDFETGESRMR